MWIATTWAKRLQATLLKSNNNSHHDGRSMLGAALGSAIVAYGGLGGLLLDDDDDDKKEQQEQQGRFMPPAVDIFFQQFQKQTTPIAVAASMMMMMMGVDNNKSHCESGGFSLLSRLSNLRRQKTFRLLEDTRERDHILETAYAVEWATPIGEGTFGSVYRAVEKKTGQIVAVKKISKATSANSETFRREMDAMLHIRANGGHPNICGLRANYDQGNHFYLVLDMITGGEMFDHLSAQGAYSEADAARLMREVASALAFLHGLDIVHGDLKPENLMLSTSKSSNAVVKVVDFGSAHFVGGNNKQQQDEEEEEEEVMGLAATPAYSSPEFLLQSKDQSSTASIDPAFDMWALGTILYIMLTGVHPFDLYGDASDEEIQHAIVSGHRPPLKRSPLTAHLSGHAIQLISKLLEWDPNKRMTAIELLEDPWIRGETARRKKMADSDKRLATYRTFKTRFEAKVFADMLSWSNENANANADDNEAKNVTNRTSLIERAFRSLDPDDKGYVTAQQLKEASGHESAEEGGPLNEHQLNLSGFSDLLGENMKNKYFKKGEFIYRQGDIGNCMYFINSGTIEVTTGDGSRQERHTGDFFGEGALLNPKRIRSANIRTLTPVHVIEISREYFEKYLSSNSNLKINLAEKDRGRKRHRAKTILQLQQHMKERNVKQGAAVFRKGEPGNELYLLEQGEVNLTLDGKNVVSKVHEGTMTGEHSLIFGKPRNINAICTSKDGCKLQTLPAKDFYVLLDSHPSLKEGITDICYRREFKKSLCHALKRNFPREEHELKSAFKEISTDGVLTIEHMRELIHQFDETYTEDEIESILNSLSLSQKGRVTWEEFRHIFGMDEKSSE